MNKTLNPSDYGYEYPPEISNQAKQDLCEIREIGDLTRRSNAWKKFLGRYFKEVKSREEVCTQNVSNFTFLLRLRDKNDSQLINSVIRNYCNHTGFSFRDGKFSCNVQRAMDLMYGDYLGQVAV